MKSKTTTQHQLTVYEALSVVATELRPRIMPNLQKMPDCKLQEAYSNLWSLTSLALDTVGQVPPVLDEMYWATFNETQKRYKKEEAAMQTVEEIVKEVNDVMPRLDRLRLLAAVKEIGVERSRESMQAMKSGENFYKTQLGKTFRMTKR